MRCFFTPHPNPGTGAPNALPFDVIADLWFEDDAKFKGTMKLPSVSIMPDDVVADEKKMFDRPKLRIATVVEHESILSK